MPRAHLEQRLEAMGREVEVESVDVWPNWPLTYALLAGLGDRWQRRCRCPCRCLVPRSSCSRPCSPSSSATECSWAAAAAARAPRVAERDLARGRDKGGTLVLVAHYDAGRGGLAFNRKLHSNRATFGKP